MDLSCALTGIAFGSGLAIGFIAVLMITGSLAALLIWLLFIRESHKDGMEENE